MISDEQVLFLVLQLRRRIRREEAIKEKPLKKGLGKVNLSYPEKRKAGEGAHARRSRVIFQVWKKKLALTMNERTRKNNTDKLKNLSAHRAGEINVRAKSRWQIRRGERARSSKHATKIVSLATLRTRREVSREIWISTGCNEVTDLIRIKWVRQ